MSVVHNSALKHDFNLEISDEVQTDVLNTHIEALKYGVTETYDYRPVIASKDVAQMALYMPSILLVFNASLDVLSQPEVVAKLPGEVVDRKEVGLAQIEELAERAVQSDDFIDAHVQHFDLLESEINQLRVSDRIINTFAGAILSDTAPIMGGAALFLLQEGQNPEEIKDTVARSPMARFISKSSQPRGATAQLGDKYCSLLYYQWTNDTEVPMVDFTPEAKSIFNERVGDGCPARRIALPEVRRNLFTETWHRTAAYLLQDGFEVCHR